MKKTILAALSAAALLTSCGNAPAAATAGETAEPGVVESSDIAYVQVEAVLAQCDLYLNEGAALQEKTEKAQRSWAQKEKNIQAEAAQLEEKYVGTEWHTALFQEVAEQCGGNCAEQFRQLSEWKRLSNLRNLRVSESILREQGTNVEFMRQTIEDRKSVV